MQDCQDEVLKLNTLKRHLEVLESIISRLLPVLRFLRVSAVLFLEPILKTSSDTLCTVLCYFLCIENIISYLFRQEGVGAGFHPGQPIFVSEYAFHMSQWFFTSIQALKHDWADPSVSAHHSHTKWRVGSDFYNKRSTRLILAPPQPLPLLRMPHCFLHFSPQTAVRVGLTEKCIVCPHSVQFGCQS